MSQLDYRVITATVDAGGTTSNEVDLGRSYRKVYLSTPSPIQGAAVLYGALNSGGTYKQLYNSGATATIASGISNMMIDLDDYAYVRHMKIVLTATVSAAATYHFVCVD